MNIYVDFDDCLCETAHYFTNLVWEMFGKKVAYEDVHCFNMQESFDLTDEEYEKLILKYDHARPFTKESLMYREIFEEYYPGQSEMVKDFWMPNKEWEGCDVNDPSARVLSNYGESGH